MATGIIEKLEDVTPTVLRAMSGADNARLRTVMEALKSVPWDRVGEESKKIAAAMTRSRLRKSGRRG